MAPAFSLLKRGLVAYHFFFFAAQGLQPFFAAQGLQPFFAAQGLQPFFAAQGLHFANCTEKSGASAAETAMGATEALAAKAATLTETRVFLNM